MTGGKYYRAEDTDGLRQIYDEINQLEQSEVEVQVFNQYQELSSLAPDSRLLPHDSGNGITQDNV